MGSAILVILAAVIPFVLKAIAQHSANAATPEAKMTKETNENQKSIVDGHAGDLLIDRLNRLHNQDGSN